MARIGGVIVASALVAGSFVLIAAGLSLWFEYGRGRRVRAAVLDEFQLLERVESGSKHADYLQMRVRSQLEKYLREQAALRAHRLSTRAVLGSGCRV
jgi:hypothetical protein